MKSKRATIADVARLAGVSEAMVSRTLNNSPLQSPESAAKIQSAMRELNYSPRRNKLRTLNRQRQKKAVAALLLPDISPAGMGSELFRQLAAGVERELMEHNFDMFACCLEKDGALPEMLRTPGQVAGVIVRSDWCRLPAAKMKKNLAQLSIFPQVYAFSHNTAGGDCVGVDNSSCAKWAFEQVKKIRPEKVICAVPERLVPNEDVHIRSSLFQYLCSNAGIDCRIVQFDANAPGDMMPGWNPDEKTVVFAVAHDAQVLKAAEYLSRHKYSTTLLGVMTGTLPSEYRKAGIRTIHIDPFRVGVSAAGLLCRRISHPYEDSITYLIPPREFKKKR